MTPAQLPAAARPAIRQSHRPLLLDPSGRTSPPWLATAGPVPPPTARCHAPDIAGHRGCRTAARRCGRPDSANRTSAGYTDAGRRASASRYICGPCRTLSRAEWRSPRAGGSSGRSRGVTTLGLVAQAPTNPPRGRARPSRSRITLHRTPRRSGSPGTVWERPATRRPNRRRLLHRGACHRPVMRRQARSGQRGRPNWSSMVRSGPFSLPGAAQRGLCGELEQHIQDEEG